MDAKEILKDMGKLKSFYGGGARKYIDDEVKGPQFLIEVNEQLTDNPNSLDEHFGKKMVLQIKEFCKNHKP